MMNTPGRANYIKIDGKPYFLAITELDSKIPNWTKDYVATQAGDPTVPRWVRFNDWSRGIGDSRGLIRGGVEYAENAFLGALGRILPGPVIGTINTGHSSEITCFVDVTLPLTRVLAGGGTKVSEINPATQTVSTVRTVSGGSVLSMALFIDQVAIALGDSNAFERRTSGGSYSANTDSLYARAFGISGSSLVRGRDAYWSRCEAAAFQTRSNWTAEFDIGDKSGKINQVFEHQRFDYILKDEGLYTWDDEAEQEANVLTDLKTWKSPENRSYARWSELLFVPSLAGLYRYQGGLARTVGIEEVPLNESEIASAYPTAMAAFGKWAYVAYYNGTSTWICLMRRAQDGDASMGAPFTLISVVDKFTGKCLAMHVSSLTSPPTLYYGGTTGNVRYFTLTRDGLPSSYHTGTVTVRMSPTDLNSPMTMKFFKSIEVYGRNISGSKSIQLQAAMDGGSLNNVGSSITSLSSGYARRFWTQGSNDQGRVIQIALTLTNTGGGSSPAEVREVQLNFEERPEMVEAYSTAIRCEDGMSEGAIVDNRSANAVRADLEALVDGAVVDIVDPYGNTFKGRIAQLRESANGQMRDMQPTDTVPIQIRRLDYS